MRDFERPFDRTWSLTWPAHIDLPVGRWAALRVVDTGIGIEAGDLPHLFERFYRVKDQGNIPGTGLGLSIAQELIELHGGQIAMHSVPGEGSTCSIVIARFQLHRFVEIPQLLLFQMHAFFFLTAPFPPTIVLHPYKNVGLCETPAEAISGIVFQFNMHLSLDPHN